MDIGTLRAERHNVILAAARHGARSVRVFGSVARAEADAHSDVDLLVEFEPGRTLLDRAALYLDLTELLGCEVHGVTARGLRPRGRDRVLREAVAQCLAEDRSTVASREPRVGVCMQIELRQATKSFRSTQALAAVSLTVEPGQIVAVVGGDARRLATRGGLTVWGRLGAETGRAADGVPAAGHRWQMSRVGPRRS